MLRHSSPALLAVALAAACAAPAPERASESRQAVIGGEPSDATQDGVLLLRAALADESELICTASLVAPNLVLTARHCVAYLSEGLFSCNARGELDPSDAQGGRLGLHLPPAALELYAGSPPRRAPLARGERIFSTLSPTICTNDIALVLLDRALELPLLPLRLEARAEAGEPSVLVGFGMIGNDAGLDYVTQPRLQRRDLRIAAVGPSSVRDGVTTVPPRSILLRGPSGCIGDSGGPLLSQVSGAVLGVYSLQAGESCSAANVTQQLVQVEPFKELFAEAFEAAGATPLPEPPSQDAGGEAGQPATPAAPSQGGVGGAAEDPEPDAPPPQSSGCAVTSATRPVQLGWLFVGAAILRRPRRARRR